MQLVCAAYNKFYSNNPPIPTRCLREMLKLILDKNSFKFANKLYLQRHGTAMGTKAAVAFANIFMAEIETHLRRQSKHKPLEWIRYIDDIASFKVTTKMKSYNSFGKQTSSTQHQIYSWNIRVKPRSYTQHYTKAANALQPETDHFKSLSRNPFKKKLQINYTTYYWIFFILFPSWKKYYILLILCRTLFIYFYVFIYLFI